MKNRTMLCILLCVLFMSFMVPSAFSDTIFPLEGQECASFPYTKEDEALYQAIFEGAYLSATEGQRKEWDLMEQKNIDFFASMEENDFSKFPVVFGVPDENAISKEGAIYSAYAAMKSLFDYTDEMLIRFYPICSYDVKDPENPRWYIVFDPVEKVQGYYYFSVFVDAKDGRVLMVTDNTGDAVG